MHRCISICTLKLVIMGEVDQWEVEQDKDLLVERDNERDKGLVERDKGLVVLDKGLLVELDKGLVERDKDQAVLDKELLVDREQLAVGN